MPPECSLSLSHTHTHTHTNTNTLEHTHRDTPSSLLWTYNLDYSNFLDLPGHA